MTTRGAHESLGYLPATVAAREGVHRRAVLLGIAALLVFSTSPIFGHHLSAKADTLLAGKDHLWAICLTALHHLLAPVHLGFHVVIIAGLAYALWDRLRAWRTARRTLAALPVCAAVPGDPFWSAAASAGVDPRRLRIVDGLPNPAFTAGWLRPVIYVARELVDRLSPPELAALLAHEAAHVRRRDPLRLSLLRFLALTLFWLPALRRLADDAADEAEVEADDAAASGHPLVLASAILALASWAAPRSLVRGAVGFYRADLLERRIRRLAGEDTPVRSHVTRRSIAGAALALGLVWASGVMMVHPLPAGHAHGPLHCVHRGEWALSHLFCLRTAHAVEASAAGHCPHIGR